tara:strand:- start:22 stop:594 length:573 start_codon:yes stop_codon:yes gene_type:complete
MTQFITEYPTTPIRIQTPYGYANVPCDFKNPEVHLAITKEQSINSSILEDERVGKALLNMCEALEECRKEQIKHFLKGQKDTKDFCKAGLAELTEFSEGHPIKEHVKLLYKFFVAMTIFQKDKVLELEAEIKEQNYKLLEVAEDGVDSGEFLEGRYLEFSNLLMDLGKNIIAVVNYANKCDFWRDGKDYI